MYAKYDFIEGVELGASPMETSSKKALTLNQSVCVFGDPVEVPRLTIDKSLIKHAKVLCETNEGVRRGVEQNSDPEWVKGKCTWYMKELLRSANEITLERSHKYTRDLYKCYELFSEYYPEKESEMREVLYLALNPTEDKVKLVHMVDTIGTWLESESKLYF